MKADTHAAENQKATPKLLRPRQVAEALGVSLATLWRIQKRDANFPRAFRISAQALAFESTEIADWVESRRVTQPTTT